MGTEVFILVWFSAAYLLTVQYRLQSCLSMHLGRTQVHGEESVILSSPFTVTVYIEYR